MENGTTNLHWKIERLFTFFIELLQNQAASIPAMEFMCFKKCKEFLMTYGITTCISDRHSSISCYMKTTLKNVKHYFDLWHIKKSELNFLNS